MENSESLASMITNVKKRGHTYSPWALVFRNVLIALNISGSSFQECLSVRANKDIASGNNLTHLELIDSYLKICYKPDMTQEEMAASLLMIGVEEYWVEVEVNSHRDERITPLRSRVCFNCDVPLNKE